ncbi:flagellin [Solirubrobacter phytolaccae]|uniref:Flagellin n=1 Tax=Solirubrobacter phytolaccae TaxID=1404360 RepID=A0A9X3SAL4_9ACTN|nr:flagellin [Solirubrobacter phytolaccae]MDA0183828.1 flagellin [Solirubrobacter phytolaccae]
MGLRIQNNIEAFNTHRQLTATSSQASKSMEKLSSGYRINRAADDAAGLGISEKMRGQIGGLGQAQRNAQDAISLVQTAEGALAEVHSMLERVRDLKVQINNGTLDNNDQQAIGAEVVEIAKEISTILSDTKFNGKTLFGTSSTFKFQVGANEGETISMGAPAFSGDASTGGLSNLTGLSTATASAAASGMLLTGGSVSDIGTIDDMIENVSKQRGTYGAVQNRLEHRLANLATYQENLTASESRIRDVDMASEMTKFTKLNILQQAGTSMLAQANQAPQGVLSLLR